MFSLDEQSYRTHEVKNVIASAAIRCTQFDHGDPDPVPPVLIERLGRQHEQRSDIAGGSEVMNDD